MTKAQYSEGSKEGVVNSAHLDWEAAKGKRPGKSGQVLQRITPLS